jgi:hypothetical protein
MFYAIMKARHTGTIFLSLHSFPVLSTSATLETLCVMDPAGNGMHDDTMGHLRWLDLQTLVRKDNNFGSSCWISYDNLERLDGWP